MFENELNRIEEELNICLPHVYKVFMADYPLRHYVNNASTDLWDEPSEIIERNKRCHTCWAKGFIAWPNYLFFIGNSLCSASYAIDLRNDSAPVWFVDYDAVESKSTGVISSSFAEWATNYIEDLRSDLIVDGVDPDSEPS